jgi:pimeloyl-ACP methyl ester carboxylesterase
MSFRPPRREKEVSAGRAGISPDSRRKGHLDHKFLATLLVAPGVLTLGYEGISFFVARKVAYAPPKAITRTPADLGLSYRDVSFPSRENYLLLRGWFIPGVLPNGQLTTERTIIMLHGVHSNRAALEAGLLDLSGALARRGFAVLAFDMRGQGQSAPAPISMGYFEQYDVLGAVDFLRSGPLPYPELGRPRAIGGWGISMGGSAMLLAAAREPAIRAVIARSPHLCHSLKKTLKYRVCSFRVSQKPCACSMASTMMLYVPWTLWQALRRVPFSSSRAVWTQSFRPGIWSCWLTRPQMRRMRTSRPGLFAAQITFSPIM